MTTALFVLAAVMMLAGLVGTILPALPGVPLIFAGMLLAAWADGFMHIGVWTMVLLGFLCLLAIAVDVVASLVGAKRVGASGWALFGAAVGTFAGFFFGIPGLLLGPFVGALIGELVAGGSMRRATEVGFGTWIGLLFGTLAKIALSFAMLGIFVFALLF